MLVRVDLAVLLGLDKKGERFWQSPKGVSRMRCVRSLACLLKKAFVLSHLVNRIGRRAPLLTAFISSVAIRYPFAVGWVAREQPDTIEGVTLSNYRIQEAE